MHEDNYKKLLEFRKKILKGIKPRFSFHYVAYTILFTFIIFSVVSIVTATTPNPGHPWNELGDGVFSVTNNQTALRTYTFPDANATVLTTNDTVTVAQGGTGLNSIPDKSLIVTTGTNTLGALVIGAGQSIRRNATDTAFEAFTPGDVTNLAGGLGGSIPYQSGVGTTSMLANGTAGQVLQSNGTTLAPSWVTLGVTNWDLIGSPTADGSIAMGSTIQTMDWATATTQKDFSLTGNTITSGTLLSATSSSVSTTTAGVNIGSMLDITESGAMTAFTGSLASINASGTNTVGSTGSALSINIAGTAQLMKGIKFNDATTGALGTTATSGAVLFSMNGNHTGYGVQVYDVTRTGNAFVVSDSAAMTAGSGILVKLSGLAVAGSTTSASGVTITMTGTTYNTQRFMRFTNTAGTEIGSINNSSATAVTYATSSDRRLKSNIVDTHFGLTDLMNIGVKDFTWNADGTSDTGFIAQDLYAIYPNAVTKGDNGIDPYVDGVTNTWLVDYGRVTPIIVKAIQDQQNLLGNFTDNSLNFTTFISDVKSETAHDPISIIESSITNGRKVLVDFITTRVTAIRGYFDETFTNKTHQKTLCIGDLSNEGETCITKTELDKLLQDNTVTVVTPETVIPDPIVVPEVTVIPEVNH